MKVTQNLILLKTKGQTVQVLKLKAMRTEVAAIFALIVAVSMWIEMGIIYVMIVQLAAIAAML